MKLVTLLRKKFYVFECESEDEEGNAVNTIEVYENEEDCEPVGTFYELEDKKFRWGNIFGKIPHNTIMTEQEIKDVIKKGAFF